MVDDWKNELPLWATTQDKKIKWIEAYAVGANKVAFDDEKLCDAFCKIKFSSSSQPSITVHASSSSIENIIQPAINSVTPQPDLKSCVDKIFTVYNMKIINTLYLNETKLLFCRDEMISLWNELDKTYYKSISNFELLKSNTIGYHIVVGCPGIGKTLTVISHGIHLATEKKKKVAICFFTDSSTVRIVYFDQMIDSTNAVIIQMNLLENNLIKDFLSKFEFVILDGITKLIQIFKTVFFGLVEKKVYTVICASLEIPIFTGSEVESLIGVGVKTRVESWTYDDILAAAQIGVIVLDKTTSTIDEMFYYCGGSIRLYQYSIEYVSSFLKENFESLQKDYAFMLSNSFDNTNNTSNKNSLIQCINGKSMLLSKFVLTLLLNRVSIEFIASLKELMKDSSVWVGWFAELEMITRIKQSIHSEFLFALEDGSVVSLVCKGVHDYYENEKDLLLTPNCFYIPNKWNQGCFDVFYYFLKNNVPSYYFINCTIALKHDFKLVYVSHVLFKNHSTELETASKRSKPNVFADSSKSIISKQICSVTICRFTTIETKDNSFAYSFQDLNFVEQFDPTFSTTVYSYYFDISPLSYISYKIKSMFSWN